MSETRMPLTKDELLARLEAMGLATRTVTHAPLFSVADSQALRGSIPGGHTKNLFCKDKKGRFFLVVADEEARVDLKALSRLVGASGRLSFAGPEAMMAHLGVSPGAVTAFGVVNDGAGAVTLVLDRSLLAHDMVNCHPLTNEATTAIAPADLMAFLRSTGHEPLVLDLPEPDEASAPDTNLQG